MIEEIGPRPGREIRYDCDVYKNLQAKWLDISVKDKSALAEGAKSAAEMGRLLSSSENDEKLGALMSRCNWKEHSLKSGTYSLKMCNECGSEAVDREATYSTYYHCDSCSCKTM